MRFDALPAATLVYANSKQLKHVAQIFNIGIGHTIENVDVNYIKYRIENLIEQYLKERENKA